MKAFFAASVCALALGAQGAAEPKVASAPGAAKAISPAASRSLARLEQAQQEAASSFLLSLGADKAVFEDDKMLRLLNASSTVAEVTTTRLGSYTLEEFGNPEGPLKARNGSWLGKPLSVLLGKGPEGKKELVGLDLSEPRVKGRDISFKVAIKVEDPKQRRPEEPPYVGSLVERVLKDAFRGIGPKPLNATKAGEALLDVQLFINADRLALGHIVMNHTAPMNHTVPVMTHTAPMNHSAPMNQTNKP